ncbi:MAG: hypothetical protein LBP78_05700 [Acidaminococcales bacterium]|jgi:uncharacterized protein with HEPN domain|nr:hypothetical protein [Acidaminococcales bacterium]
MNGRDRLNIERIADELRYINSAAARTSREEFLLDETLQRALSMSILTIGECARRLSDGFKGSHPQY